MKYPTYVIIFRLAVTGVGLAFKCMYIFVNVCP